MRNHNKDKSQNQGRRPSRRGDRFNDTNNAAFIHQEQTPKALPKLPEALLDALAVPPLGGSKINAFVSWTPKGMVLNDAPEALFRAFGAFAVRAHCATCDAPFDFIILDDQHRTCRPSRVPGKTKAFLGSINMETGEVTGSMVKFLGWGGK